MIVRARDLWNCAYGKYGIGAYLVCNLEECMGLFRGGLVSRAPFIVLISRGARSYTHPRMLEAMIRAADQIFPEAMFMVHLTHGDEKTCYECIHSGLYGSVMIDAGNESFENNIAITQQVVEAAHKKGVAVESSPGRSHVLGMEERIGLSESDAINTEVAQMTEFVQRTGCDSLAYEIGPRFGTAQYGVSTFNLEVIRDFQKRLPGVPLVAHGASRIVEEAPAINAAGGRVANTNGIAESALQSAVKLGVTQLGFEYANRRVWHRVCQEFFRDHPDQIDPRAPGKAFMDEFAKFVARTNERLGSAGRLESARAMF